MEVDMSTVFCAKYKKELPALEKAPFPGEAGIEILQNISSAAWNEWLQFQTMVINEERLNMMDPNARKFLTELRTKFLFSDEELDMPSDFVDPNIPNLR
jgi:Fe-S cluster biosynthesis and repair protein YggX